jgi:hypothetical protein
MFDGGGLHLTWFEYFVKTAPLEAWDLFGRPYGIFPFPGFGPLAIA